MVQSMRETYKVSEVAEALGLSTQSIYTLIRKGIIPAMKVGGVWRVSASWEAELAENCPKGTDTEIAGLPE